MYAVIQTGGKQYRVREGDTLKTEKINAKSGDNIEFDKVLMIQAQNNTQLGNPFLENSKVTAIVTAQGRHKKIKIIKFQRRKQHMKQMGHRQYLTELRITGIYT